MAKVFVLNPPFKIPLIREGRCQSPQNMRKTSIPQLTLAYISAFLSKNGHLVQTLDCIASDLHDEQVFDIAKQFDPQVILINTTTPSISSDLNFAETFKRKFPNCFLAVFGTHVTALHKTLIYEHPFLDFIIRGEPEWLSLALVSSLEKHEFTDSSLPGCTFRWQGQVHISAEPEFPNDLDSLGFPAWNHFDLSKYIHPVLGKPYLMVNTSRGCSHGCIFCVGHLFYGKKVRFRSISSIIEELENHVIGKFNIRHVWMYADDFTANPAFVKELCRQIIKRKIRITWWTNTRVDRPDEEMFRLMKEAGCYMLSIGGESGSDEILKTIRKGTHPDQIKRTIRLLKKVGINSLVYFLIGLPGETRESIRKTIDFSKKINPDYVEFYPATPYPGTEFFNYAKNNNIIKVESWEKYLCGGSEFVLEIPGVEKGELNFILRQAYREFYFRLSYAFSFFKRSLKPAELFRLITFGLGYFKRFFFSE
ncbi:MAG: radical SAM protein [Candidatus Riflebacteria bacterium]|nr:radical SAM protein [Candidatus Riflebacteria bacterium]